jgi:FKBP-type peptidyl-prolyl cis-trans isomerase
MKLKSTALLAALAVLCAAALATAQRAPTDRSQDSAWLNAQSAALASRQAKDGWQWMPGGLLWRRVAGDGSGPHPTADDVVTVHYEGTFVDGGKFDSSYDRGEPISFPLRGVIPAWTMAVPNMGVGDTIELAAPSTLAYGPVGRGPIPGGATLLFKIELLAIER